MIAVHRLIGTWLGIGYIGKGSGTVAALVCCICWYFLCRNGYNSTLQLVIIFFTIAIGIWSAGKVEAEWGKDSNKVVIDEAAGMFISLLWIPVQLKYIIPAFILFRFFDIVKPLYIRKLEKWPGGWGVMADDLLAGIYSNAILQGIVISNLF